MRDLQGYALPSPMTTRIFPPPAETADITDIDPDSFTITAQPGTDDKFAKMFEVVREGTSNNWRIKLKDGVSLDYEDPDPTRRR